MTPPKPAKLTDHDRQFIMTLMYAQMRIIDRDATTKTLLKLSAEATLEADSNISGFLEFYLKFRQGVARARRTPKAQVLTRKE